MRKVGFYHSLLNEVHLAVHQRKLSQQHSCVVCPSDHLAVHQKAGNLLHEKYSDEHCYLMMHVKLEMRNPNLVRKI